VLEDRDGDGRYEKARVFADKLVFPMGLLWRDGRLYVCDPPEVVVYETGENLPPITGRKLPALTMFPASACSGLCVAVHSPGARRRGGGGRRRW